MFARNFVVIPSILCTNDLTVTLFVAYNLSSLPTAFVSPLPPF